MSSVDLTNLRAWQQEAFEAYRVRNRADFCVTATPGAGKTTFAVTLARKLLEVKDIQQIIVVVPTDHLRTQWAESAIESDVFLDPSLSNSVIGVSDDFIGYVVTYAQVASRPEIHQRRAAAKRTLVIFDEIHHAGDGLSWGVAVKQAFQGARRRLSLTGTPFRTSPNSPIPFVRYSNEPDGTKISVSDYAYGYGDALRDKVVRPVTFAAYSGDASWQDSAGAVYSSGLLEADTKDIERKALRAALDPEGAWIPHVLRAAHERLLQTRETFPDAAGMVLASDQDSANAYAALLRKITRGPVTVVISDDNKADKKIDAFRTSTDPWLVAVRMVSEGVDIPRLMVGVWATNYRTPLFFAQAVGRFVRARKNTEVATVFLPAIKPLLALASEMEEQRKHVLMTRPTEDDLEEVALEEKANTEERVMNTLTTLESSASFDHVLFNGRAIDGNTLDLTPEEEEYLGLPGLLSPNQMASLLRNRDHELKLQGVATGSRITEPQQENIFKKIASTKRDINRVVSRVALARGVAHAYVHKLTQKQVPGPPSSVATLAILEERLAWLQKTFSVH